MAVARNNIDMILKMNSSNKYKEEANYRDRAHNERHSTSESMESIKEEGHRITRDYGTNNKFEMEDASKRKS
jgi:hypothetical protein